MQSSHENVAIFLCSKTIPKIKQPVGGIDMEVKINKEIRDYTESMFFGLSLRQFAFSGVAIGVAVGAFFLLKPHLGTEAVS